MIDPGRRRRGTLDRFARAQERPAQVDPRTLSKSAADSSCAARDLDAGVVDQHVDAAELIDGVLEHADDVVLLRDVALHEHVADALMLHLLQAGVHLVPGRLASSGGRQVVDGDVGAVLRNRTAIAWPIPDVPPVIRTFLPFNPRIPSDTRAASARPIGVAPSRQVRGLLQRRFINRVAPMPVSRRCLWSYS